MQKNEKPAKRIILSNLNTRQFQTCEGSHDAKVLQLD